MQFLIHQNIVRRQISMNHTRRVHILQCTQHLKHNKHAMKVMQFEVEVVVVRVDNHTLQCAIQFGHNEIDFIEIVALGTTRWYHIQQIDHILMMKMLQYTNLAINALAVLDVTEHTFIFFDRHFTSIASIFRLNHHSVRAKTNHFGRFIILPQQKCLIVECPRHSLLVVRSIQHIFRGLRCTTLVINVAVAVNAFMLVVQRR
mmetsp:Transcript_24358/g.39213  ORF Transcript_24358/g.39213 Transcript_24358/m.39213 type:complete len:202 (+) Transcript_24358:1246-1851(+)